MRAVNLIPSEQRSGTGLVGRSDGGAFIVLGLLAGLALLAFLYGTAHRQISSRRGQVAALTAQGNAAQAQSAQLAPYTSFIAMSSERVQAVSQLVQSRFDWAHAFHEFGRVLPKGASLISIRGIIGSAGGSAGAGAAAGGRAAKGAAAPGSAATSEAAGGSAATGAAGATSAATSATPPGSVPSFTVGGCATSQSEVAQTLQRLRLIDGVSEVQLQTSAKGAGGGAAAAAGGCPPGDPAFTVQIAFLALPGAATNGSPTTATGSPTTATGSGAATTSRASSTVQGAGG